MRKFKLLIFILAMTLFISSHKPKESFLKNQLEFKRVKDAYNFHNKSISKKLTALKVDELNLQILFIAYKANKKLEVYVGNPEKQMSLFKTYDVCAQSGDIGPKNQSGDNQTPEGYYYINRFNPASNFHLSLGLNYPNQADKIRSNASDLGGDIFIHGNCVSIGCLAMTDESIKEIYTLAILARNSNQMKIPVIIAPFTMLQSKKMDFDKQADLKPYAKYFGLWKSIFEGISDFHKTKQLPKFTISKAGSYIITK
jgi:murein L,D-transpeptidase YafK